MKGNDERHPVRYGLYKGGGIHNHPQLSMEQYRMEMRGVYSTCIAPDTLDESPMAYKSMEEITRQIEPTVQIVEHIRPIYNFKATES